MLDDEVAGAWEALATRGPCWRLAREALIEYYRPLAERLARKRCRSLPRSVEFDDMFQIAVLGLISAVDKFDHTINEQFDLFASTYIGGRMLDELRTQDRLSRHHRKIVRDAELAAHSIELDQGRPATVDEIVKRTSLGKQAVVTAYRQLDRAKLVVYEDAAMGEPAKTPSPDSTAAVNRAIDAADIILDDLDEDAQLVVALRYYWSKSLGEISAMTGMHETVVSKHHAEAVARIHAAVSTTLSPRMEDGAYSA